MIVRRNAAAFQAGMGQWKSGENRATCTSINRNIPLIGTSFIGSLESNTRLIREGINGF